MAGKVCPKCKKMTLFETNTGRECSKCGYSVNMPLNDRKGGRGKKCVMCGKMTVFNGKCTKCGAKEGN